MVFSMSATECWYIHCDGDGCDNSEEATGGEGSMAYGSTLANYRRHLARSGWVRVGKYDLCPECVKDGRRPACK